MSVSEKDTRLQEISFSQEISGTIIDFDSSEKLPYANITFLKVNKGNYSKEDGSFKLTLPNKDLITDSASIIDPKEAFCDGTLRILNSNLREIAKVKFQDLFPISLTSLDFDATNADVEYFTAEATFKYTIYDLTSSL